MSLAFLKWHIEEVKRWSRLSLLPVARARDAYEHGAPKRKKQDRNSPLKEGPCMYISKVVLAFVLLERERVRHEVTRSQDRVRHLGASVVDKRPCHPDRHFQATELPT
jgi:hypothetical protein